MPFGRNRTGLTTTTTMMMMISNPRLHPSGLLPLSLRIWKIPTVTKKSRRSLVERLSKPILELVSKPGRKALAGRFQQLQLRRRTVYSSQTPQSWDPKHNPSSHDGKRISGRHRRWRESIHTTCKSQKQETEDFVRNGPSYWNR